MSLPPAEDLEKFMILRGAILGDIMIARFPSSPLNWHYNSIGNILDLRLRLHFDEIGADVGGVKHTNA